MKRNEQVTQKAEKHYSSPEQRKVAKFEESSVAVYGATPGMIFPSNVSKPHSQMTTFDKMDVIRKGISKSDFEVFKQRAGLDYDQLAATLLVARATLINKKGAEKFNQTLSEKIFSLADIYSYGYEVFEDTGRFNFWIFRSNAALGGLAPFDLLDNQYGREEVKDLIGRIDYGVYS